MRAMNCRSCPRPTRSHATTSCGTWRRSRSSSPDVSGPRRSPANCSSEEDSASSTARRTCLPASRAARDGNTITEPAEARWTDATVASLLSPVIAANPGFGHDVPEVRHGPEGQAAFYAALRDEPDDLDRIRRCFDDLASATNGATRWRKCAAMRPSTCLPPTPRTTPCCDR